MRQIASGCLRLAGEISNLRRCLQRRQLPRAIDIASPPEPSDLPLLPEMERTVALIPQAFSGTKSVSEVFLPAPLDAEVRSRLFVPDAFSNVDHLKFAVRGTLATMLAYVVYQAIDWPGLSTSIATCIITALSTIGASRQKQFLRLGGAIIGGFVFGMGAQIFVLPHLDSITGFTVLFAIVTAIAAWIATATPRLSYLGVQLALAFYLINLQEFAAQILFGHRPRPCRWSTAWAVIHVAGLRSTVGEGCSAGDARRVLPQFANAGRTLRTIAQKTTARKQSGGS